jgi:hypothetical protein
MKASELINLLQKQMEVMNCDPYVVIQHPNDDGFNQKDVELRRRGLWGGYIGTTPTITLTHADTLLGEKVKEQIWRRFPELESYLE